METKVRKAFFALLVTVILALSIPWKDILESIRDPLVSLVPDGPYAQIFIIVIGAIFSLSLLAIARDDADNISSSLFNLISNLITKR